MRGLDDALRLSDLASGARSDSLRRKNTTHWLDGQFRQSVYGRLAGYEDFNDADQLALDPVMRQVVGGRAVDAQAASAWLCCIDSVEIGGFLFACHCDSRCG